MIDSEARKAADIILSGEIILYPTDTIWGIGCDATRAESVQKIYQIKQRSDSKSMLVLVNGIAMLENYLAAVPTQALDLIEQAKKPTTIIYPGAQNLADNLLASDGSIGIRISSDSFCKRVIEYTGKPIVSTSANISGGSSPAIFQEIPATIRSSVSYIVRWRRDEKTPSAPSAIIKLEEDGSITTLRS